MILMISMMKTLKMMGAARSTSLEKRRLIDNMLEEKRLARELRDGFDDDFDDFDDEDFDDEDFDDEAEED